MDELHDVVVVGGGSTGCVVAARLAEAGVDVCLLESGPSDAGDERILEIGRWPSLVDCELSRSYPVERQERGNSAAVCPAASVLGGCGSHNQAVAISPQQSDLERWRRCGADGWDFATTRPFYERVFERVHVEEASHGNACAAAFVSAGEQAGFRRTSFRPPRVDGVGWLPLNVRDGLRQSSSVAYLHPLAAATTSLTVRTGTDVERVLFEDRRAIGVETTHGTVGARREVVLCAGAIETPKLLLLSGVGPAAELREVGVRVLHDLPGVGRSLTVHPDATIAWEAPRPVPTGVVQDWEAGLLGRSQPSLALPDVMLLLGTAPTSLPDGCPPSAHPFCLLVYVALPASRGSVRLRSADPAEPPRFDPRLFTDDGRADELTIVAGMRLARRIAAAPALAEWVARELSPGAAIESDRDLFDHAARTGGVQHPMGTCRIGREDDGGAVVDRSLRVRGLGGLRIADASVFPAPIAQNINITCMMVGERCADLVLGGG